MPFSDGIRLTNYEASPENSLCIYRPKQELY